MSARTRRIILGLIIGISFAESQAACSTKIFNEDGINSCDFMDGKPDSARFIFAVMLARPHFSEENTPENREKLRKWTDSLFLKYDIHYLDSVNQRAQPPPDSLLEWAYGYLLLDKSTTMAMATEEFVMRFEYRSTPPAVNIGRPNHQAKANRHLGYVDVTGRVITPAKKNAEGKKLYARGLFHLKTTSEIESK